MISILKKMLMPVLALVLLLPVNCRANLSESMHKNPKIAAAWTAWEQGDLELARELSEKLLLEPETRDAGHHILTLIYHVQGDHSAAVNHQAQISPKYEWLSTLDEPVLWSYIHSGNIKKALEFAEQRKMSKSTLARLKLAVDRSFTVKLDGIAELPFTDDKLSPYMPGFEATFCGHRAVVRLDTGGSFIHLSSEQAKEYGIETVACGEGFSALASGKICFGVADELVLGPVVMRNIPVMVHYGTLSSKGISDAFGVELGPIIGTNILQQFLSTIDGPGRRLILSRRGDEETRGRHMVLVNKIQGNAHKLPFIMWHDHYMIAGGRANSQSARFFVDSGLVAVNGLQGQVALLASHETLKLWDTPIVESPMFSQVPGEFCLGSACRKGVTAYPVENDVWKNIGDWGDSKVNAMVSWGFLSHYVWTIDFDKYVYTLIEPVEKPAQQ